MCLHEQWQYTPLHWAAINGHEAVTRVLVEAGADVNAKDYLVQIKVQLWDVCSLLWWLRQRGGVWLHVQMQRTPLHEAARNGHEAATRALLKGGADVNAQNIVRDI